VHYGNLTQRAAVLLDADGGLSEALRQVSN
jgi:hypothetical protein